MVNTFVGPPRRPIQTSEASPQFSLDPPPKWFRERAAHRERLRKRTSNREATRAVDSIRAFIWAEVSMRRSRLVREQVELLAAQGREQPLFRDYIPEGVGAVLARACIPLEKHTAITQHEFELSRMWRVRLREFLNWLGC